MHDNFQPYFTISDTLLCGAVLSDSPGALPCSFTIDWMVRGNVRAQLRVLVKRILRKYGYPPDKQEKATQTVLEQAEVLSEL